MNKQIQKETKRKSMSTFQFYLKTDLVIFWTFWLMVIFIAVGKDDVHEAYDTVIFVMTMLIFFFGTFAISWKWQLKFIENRVNSSFDELIKEIYVAGFELEKKLGDRYVFVTRYIFLPKTRIIVRDHGSYCLIFGKEHHLRILNKAGISLIEKCNVENPVI